MGTFPLKKVWNKFNSHFGTKGTVVVSKRRETLLYNFRLLTLCERYDILLFSETLIFTNNSERITEMNERKDMDQAYMWDLSPIFIDNEAWEKEFAEIEELIPSLAGYEEDLTASSERAGKAFDAIMNVTERAEKVYVYAMLKKDSDGSDPESQSMQSRAENLFVKLQTATAYINPLLLSMDDSLLESITSGEEMSKYRRYVKDIVRARRHTLDAEGERMLAMFSEVAGAPYDAYGMLFNVDAEFPEIKDESGASVRLTNGNFGVYRASADRTVRENAFESFFGEYGKYINTSAALYSGSVKSDNCTAALRKFDDARSARLFADNVPEAVYDSLLSEIREGLPLIGKYIDVRRRALKLDEIDMFDMYVPIVADADFDVPFDVTKEIIKSALAPLGEEYASLLDRAYDERWMDVYENRGKRSGAYSCGVYGSHPYVLLNYTNKLDDLYTVAHELGHSMHSFFSSRAQTYVDNEYSIMAAEVASTVNEVFLTKYLLKTQTEERKRAYILNHFMEGFRLTVFRQAMFAEFELRAHRMQQNGEPLTAAALSEVYGELLETYYKGAKINDVMKYEWSYIPHFYRAYYVYQYATGFCSAVAIVNEILKTGDAKNYLKFLSLGGSDYPIEELKVAGVDLTKPETIKSALKEFENAIDEFAGLIK